MSIGQEIGSLSAEAQAYISEVERRARPLWSKIGTWVIGVLAFCAGVGVGLLV